MNLRTANADAAANRARDFYRVLLSGGWAEALVAYKTAPAPEVSAEAPSLSSVFTAAEARAVLLRPTTLRHYIGCLRQIAADLGNVAHTEERRDYVGGGSLGR